MLHEDKNILDCRESLFGFAVSDSGVALLAYHNFLFAYFVLIHELDSRASAYRTASPTILHELPDAASPM